MRTCACLDSNIILLLYSGGTPFPPTLLLVVFMGCGVYSLRSPRRLAHLSWWKLLARLPPYPQHVERRLSSLSASPSCVFLLDIFIPLLPFTPLSSFISWLFHLLFIFLIFSRFLFLVRSSFFYPEREELPLLLFWLRLLLDFTFFFLSLRSFTTHPFLFYPLARLHLAIFTYFFFFIGR